MKRLKQAFVAIVAVALAASSALAQPPGGQRPGGPPPGGPEHDPGRAVLEALDADHNHELSAEEMANAESALKKLDVNGDGKLSDADVRQGPASNPRGARRGANRQQGGPGRQAGPGGREGRGGPPQGPGGPPPGAGGPPQGPGGPPPGAGGPPGPEEFVQHAMQFDADEDGKLDASELMKFAEQMGPPPHGPGHPGGPGAEGGQRPDDNRQQRPARPSRPGR